MQPWFIAALGACASAFVSPHALPGKVMQATYEPAFIGPDARTARTRKLAPSATFFDVLAEDTILLDPADGTCCRNECASCSYHEEIDGEITYAYEEKTGGRWLPTQAETSVPPRLQTAKWVDVVFGEATNVTRDRFEAALDELPAEEIDVAWRTLTSAPKMLRKNEVQSKLRAISPNGAVDEAAWAAAAAETAAAPVLDVVDYESMETADLKALCKDRGIRPLPVRRLVIEDLRFYDAHGVAGVRHPATKQLSLPKKKK